MRAAVEDGLYEVGHEGLVRLGGEAREPEQEQGAARLGFKYEDIFRLQELIKEKLGRRNNAVDTGGAARAAKIISALL